MKTKKVAIYEIFNKEIETLNHVNGLAAYEHDIIKNDIVMISNYYALSTDYTDYFNVMTLLIKYVICKYRDNENVMDYLLKVIEDTYAKVIVL